MIEKDVILFVRGEQYYDGAEPDKIELTTEGTMVISEGGEIVLSYEETELTGMEGTTTRFTVREDMVILDRVGTLHSQMIFQQGVLHSSLYRTPWGDLMVDVTTSRLAHRLNEHGGILEIKYAIAVEHRVTGYNQFKIRIQDKGGR